MVSDQTAEHAFSGAGIILSEILEKQRGWETVRLRDFRHAKKQRGIGRG